MRKLILILILVMCASSCVTTYEVKKGEGKIHIGEIRVEKALTYIGSTINDTWVIQADDNGNALVAAGKGSLDLIPFYLSNAAREAYMSHLRKLVEWGGIASKEKIETKKHVGYINTSSGLFGGNVMVNTSFVSTGDGKQWFAEMNFCQLRSTGEMMAKSSRSISSNPCVKESTYYLVSESVEQLVKYLEMVPDYAGKAQTSKAKSDLLK